MEHQRSHISQRMAMNTLFEIMVYGEDYDNSVAAAESALDEIERIGKALSKYDPSSEVYRLNREAGERPVLIDYELLKLLTFCRSMWKRTDGYFDPTATSVRVEAQNHSERLSFNAVEIHEESRRVFFTHRSLKLDFGGIGKGYALDKAARILIENGITNALLHGGTSSIIALGADACGEAWKVGIRNPFSESYAEELDQIKLQNQALSSSAVFENNQLKSSDIIDPHKQRALAEEAACAVVAQTAMEAEAFSTAFLCMGKAQTKAFCATENEPNLQVLWIDKLQAVPHVTELSGHMKT